MLVLPLSQSKADTHIAPSCSQADVSSAVSAAADGDTVFVPAGSCTWTSAVSFSKALTIQGAGESMTKIAGGRFDVSVPSGKSWRITAMEVSGASFVNINGASKNFRVDHITIDSSTGYAQNRVFWIQPSGTDYVAGVIDHVTFNNPNAIQIHYRGGTSDGGNSSWMRPLGLGGPDAVYVEDSTFNNATHSVSGPVTDCEGGGRIVFRYNTVYNSYIEMHDAIIGGFRGCRKWEIYNNTFHMTYASGQCTYIHLRSGTGVISNNVFDERPDCDDGIQMNLYRTYQTGGDPWNNLCSNASGQALLNTITTYPSNCSSGTGCANKDGSSASPNGYPCRDQIGVDGNDPQTSQPALFWNNSVAGSKTITPLINSGSGYYAGGRDFCNTDTVGGSHTMPASCNGVTTSYSPYPYPHPLTASSPPAVSKTPIFPADILVK